MATILGQTRSPFRSPAYQYVRTTDKLPTTDEAGAYKDPLCRVKLFNPLGAGTWCLAGFDPDTGHAFGVADIQEREVGYFDVNDLVALRPQSAWGFVLPLERDLHWKPARLSDVLAGTVR